MSNRCFEGRILHMWAEPFQVAAQVDAAAALSILRQGKSFIPILHRLVLCFLHLFKQSFTHVTIHSAEKVQERCRECRCASCLWVSSCSGSQEGQEGEKSIYFSYHLIEPSTRQDGCNILQHGKQKLFRMCSIWSVHTSGWTCLGMHYIFVFQNTGLD